MAQNDEISIKELICIIREYIAEFKRKWRLAVLIILSTSTLGLAYSLLKKPKYIATSTMMLENSKSGGSMAGALALASQFGLMGGGSSSSSVINEDKLIEIAKSETIIKATLFKTATINSKTDILANHYIDLFGYKKKWADDDAWKDFKFVNPKEKLSVAENGVLKIFFAQITNDFLTTEKSQSGIITITVKTESELFSKYFNQYLVESLTSFYVNRITEKAQTNVDVIQKRVDSVAGALKNAEFALARWKDSNFQLVKAQGMMAEMDLRRNVEVNNSIYIEGIKQLEISKFTLLQDTPFLQIIDAPTLPIEPKRLGTLRGSGYGFILGLFLSAVFILGRKRYDELMAVDQV